MKPAIQCFFGLMLLLKLSTGRAQDSLIFHHIPNGISQNTISKIIQDKYGFLWFGTRYGLNKYDGRKFKVYLNDPLDSNSISDSRINDALLDSQNNIWLATDHGISYLDYKLGRFQVFLHDPKNPNSLSSNFTTSLFIDHKNNLWIGTEDAGLTKFNIQSGEFTRYVNNIDDPYSITSNHVTCILEDNNGNIWIGSWGGGLNLYNPSTQQFISYNTNNSNLSSNVIRVLNQADDGIWVGTVEGLFKLNYFSEGKYTFEKLVVTTNSSHSQTISAATILSLMEDKNKNLWIGTENKGLFILNKEKNRISQYLHEVVNVESISSNSIWSLYEDNTGIVWVGSFNSGLDKVDPFHRRFKHISADPRKKNSISYNIVSSFVEVPKKGLWVGTDGGGLNFMDYNTGEIKVFQHQFKNPKSLVGNAVLSLLLDNNNNLYIASWEGGLSVLKNGSDSFINVTHQPNNPNSLSGPDAFYLIQDYKSNLWISLFRVGIDIFDPNLKKIKSLKYEPFNQLSISNNKIRSIIETEPGEYWLGTEGNGLDRIKLDNQYNIFSKKNYSLDVKNSRSLSHNTISHIHKSETGKIWISTFGGGINIYNPDTDDFDRLTKENGLTSNVILSIEEDLFGNIWVGTSNGLSRIDQNYSIKQFYEYDGLQGAEFVKSASYINNAGELHFGGVNGYNVFNPGEIIENKIIPPVFINGFRVMNAPDKKFNRGRLLSDIFTSGLIELSYNENDFLFQFSVLNYSQSNKNKFAYQLVNYDDNWKIESDLDEVSYTNVPPGHYTFKVKGANNDGIWNEEGDSIMIVIEQPWFASNLAYSIYAILVSLLLLWSRQIIINRERLKIQLNLEHLQLTKMQEISELKSRFFANISHEFRTPLTLILGPLKSLINETYKGDPKNQYRVMSRNADRLLNLINQIMELSKLESGSMKLKASKRDIVKFLKPLAHSFTSFAERQFIDYKCKFPDEKVEIYFEKDKIEKVIVNLISNAFKYTPEFGKIKFSVETDDDSVILRVQDSGIGISKTDIQHIFDRFYQVESNRQKGTGIGLALTKELIDLHKGFVGAESILGKGTTFIVTLKKGTDHLQEDEMVFQNEEEENDVFDSFIERENNILPTIEPIHESNEANLEELPIILIAEDNDDVRSFICEYLVTNYHIIETSDGAEALKLANEHIPDVIIADIMMPEMNGYELCDKIKSDNRTSHIPVILLTAKVSGESKEKGFELGADYYITKPFNPKLLELRIKNILKTRDHIRSQLLNDNGYSIEPKELKIASKDQEFLKQIIHCVEENMSNSDFGVDDLCKDLGLSRTQLYRKLKGLVGQSANEFIRTFRLKRAAQLLRKQEMTISEVTYQVGFNDLQYFRYCFKNQYGVNPSEYAQTQH